MRRLIISAMGAWCYYVDQDGNVFLVPAYREAGVVRVIHLGEKPAEVPCEMSITYNLGFLFTKCGLDPINDLCRQGLSGTVALPLLVDALEKAKKITPLQMKLWNVQLNAHSLISCAKHIEENMCYESMGDWHKRFFQHMLDDLERKIGKVDSDVWGASHESLIEIYEAMIHWIKSNPDGHFKIGSH